MGCFWPKPGKTGLIVLYIFSIRHRFGCFRQRKFTPGTMALIFQVSMAAISTIDVRFETGFAVRENNRVIPDQHSRHFTSRTSGAAFRVWRETVFTNQHDVSILILYLNQTDVHIQIQASGYLI